MVKLTAEDLFDAVKNVKDTGLLELFPGLQGEMGPGKRFFESLQADVLEKTDFENLDRTLFYLAPTIRYMADANHWEPSEFTAEEMFQAVKHLQDMGAFDVIAVKLQIPGGGDRFFEYYQDILVHKIGVETLDQTLYRLGRCIKFLASDEALENRNI